MLKRRIADRQIKLASAVRRSSSRHTIFKEYAAVYYLLPVSKPEFVSAAFFSGGRYRGQLGVLPPLPLSLLLACRSLSSSPSPPPPPPPPPHSPFLLLPPPTPFPLSRPLPNSLPHFVSPSPPSPPPPPSLPPSPLSPPLSPSFYLPFPFSPHFRRLVRASLRVSALRWHDPPVLGPLGL